MSRNSQAIWCAVYGLPLIAVILCPIASAETILPVGPIVFSSNADYDNNFKEPTTWPGPFPLNGLARDAAGYLTLTNIPTSLAVFDSSATGGVGGFGGTAGGDANSDLSDFTVSADFASSVPGGVGGGFLLRLDGAEGSGYAAGVHSLDPFTIAFDLFEGASFENAGLNIYSEVVPLPFGFSVEANTFYTFSVKADGGSFLFDFANGAAQGSFTDGTVSATTGQVGIILDTLAPGVTSRLDNFQVVPEPSSFALAGLGLFGMLPILRRRIRRHSRRLR